MREITEILYEICGDERVFDRTTDLLESGILDSLAMIDLFSAIEDEFGVEIYPTRIDRSLLRTADSIRELIEKELKKS